MDAIGSLTPGSSTLHEPETIPSSQQALTPQQVELWSKTIPLSRGRAPGDPHVRTVNFHCQNVEDLRTRLRHHLARSNPEHPPEHTTIELIFPISAAFLVADPLARPQPGPKVSQAPQTLLSLFGTPNRTVMSVMEAMTPMPDPKDNMKKQRLIAKACIEAVQGADGNRYSFHNNWWSKEDEANRFSYFCNDSILNKGRSANGGSGTVGQKVRKPVYDCKGVIAVKFSAVKQNLQVQYKHLPIHRTYEERAPPPRRGTNRYRLAELYNPESLVRQHKTIPSEATACGRRKRKRRLTSDQPRPGTRDEDLIPASILTPLGLSTNDADRPTNAPSSSQGSRQKYTKQPKCTMCKTKETNCDGKVPCSSCSEIPLFCTYPEDITNDVPPREGGTEAQPVAVQPESGPAPTQTAAGPKPRKKPKAAAAAKAPKRDVQKELGAAMGEFDMLKGKLAEVGERVRRLEAEKETAELGSATRRARLPITSGPQTRTEKPGLGTTRPVGPIRPVLDKATAWKVVLPKDYASMQKKKKSQNNLHTG